MKRCEICESTRDVIELKNGALICVDCKQEFTIQMCAPRTMTEAHRRALCN